MKNVTKFFAIALILIGFSANSFGQLATSTASATILVAIDIENTTPLNFGVFSATGSPSNVILDLNDGRGTSTATLFPGGVAAKTGVFSISGTPATHFSITLPVGITSLSPLSDAGPDMTIAAGITGWSSSLSLNDALLDENGSATLKLGATLAVGANQTVGLYEGTYNITVIYN